MNLPPHVVGQQRHVEAQGEPLGRAEEHDAEEDMDQVLRQNQLHKQHKQSGGEPGWNTESAWSSAGFSPYVQTLNEFING